MMVFDIILVMLFSPLVIVGYIVGFAYAAFRFGLDKALERTP